jgi:GTP-binding protein HflX
LQEATSADLLLHLVDASHPGYPEQIEQVMSVLKDIGASEVPQWLVFNKIDALPPEQLPRLMQDMYLYDGLAIPRIFLSASTGLNLDSLRQRLLQHAQQHTDERLTLLPADEPV